MDIVHCLVLMGAGLIGFINILFGDGDKDDKLFVCSTLFTFIAGWCFGHLIFSLFL